ncbi:837_t:CDS:10 [Funneliformis geosporum]|nr:837_t:CDS:10 [Funneliformis geosporum]
MARGHYTTRSASMACKEERQRTKFFTEDFVKTMTKSTFVSWTAANPPASIFISDLSQRLKDNMHEKEKNEQSEENHPNNPIFMTESEEIETIRKTSLFAQDVTESEQDIIDKRVALQQRQYAEFERRERERKSQKIRAVFEFVSDEEIEEALKDCENDEEEVIVRMTQPRYLIEIRKTIAERNMRSYHSMLNLMTDEQKEAYEQLLKKRKETLKKWTGETAKKQYRMKGRLALDDALKQVQDNTKDLEKAFEGWSEARIKAYKAIDTKPNTYYYRFNAPGEEQKKGQWTQEEEDLFFKRLKEIGADGQWGIFSMSIPGRVGYQCSNFYRLLIETGRVKDPNYVLDEKGKAHFLFSTKNKKTGETEKTFRTHTKHGSASRKRTSSQSTSKTAPTKKKRKGPRNHDTEMDDDDVEDDNPLPGFIDPITLEAVVKPAISPYGHVMGYDSWVRCLSSEAKKNICPLTKKPLTKRELVILTKDNIDQYRFDFAMSIRSKVELNQAEKDSEGEPKKFTVVYNHFSLVRNFHLADVITIANGACGSSSIFSSIQYLITRDENFLWISLLLMPLGMVFDLFDGKVARWRRTASILGQELDSLADLISFGVAPAVCAFAVGMRTFLDTVILIIFISCGIARLARYNATVASLPKDKSGKIHYFEGTPIPTSLCIIALIAYLVKNKRIDENLLGGEIGIVQGFTFHPLVLLYGLSGMGMVSKTLKIPKI